MEDISGHLDFTGLDGHAAGAFPVLTLSPGEVDPFRILLFDPRRGDLGHRFHLIGLSVSHPGQGIAALSHDDLADVG